ncbi:hypothetical protein [Halalkalibacter hemicellulosilyticus]|nr:hypothetical protein [Halalkalibacter hemicellulosilyticus]
MRKAVTTSLIAIGIGAAAWTMNDRRRSNRLQQMMKPVNKMFK